LASSRFGQRRAGPHLLDRLLDRVDRLLDRAQRRDVGGTGRYDAESRWWRRTRRNAPRRCRSTALRFQPGPPITVEKLL
jgi:hypothetical protein